MISLNSLRPYLKFVVPAFTAIVVALIHGVSTVGLNYTELEIAVTGLVAANVSFIVSNTPAGWRSYSKALAPAVLTLGGLGVHYVFTGVWDAETAHIAIAGLVSSVLSFLVPNLPPKS